MHKVFQDTRSAGSHVGLILLVCALVLSAWLSGRGLMDEAAVSLHGDMPRHMMNGVFLWDLLKSGSFLSVDAAMDYAREYFVRYPALSLGHHPPVVAAWLVPFYAVFGISTFAARLAMVSNMAIAVLALYFVGRRLYGAWAAGFAALLFAVQPSAVTFGQQVMTEGPTLAAVLVTVVALLRFRQAPTPRSFALFLFLAVLTLYAKQVAIFMFPTYACVLLTSPEVRRRIFRRDMLLPAALGLALMAPIIAATLILSPYNLAVVTGAAMPETIAGPAEAVAPQGPALSSIFAAQFAAAFFVTVAAGAVVLLWRRDRSALFVLFWAATVVAGVAIVIGPYEAPRYAVLAVPAYCLCAAAIVTVGGTSIRRVAAIGLVLVAAWNASASARIAPVGAEGYEAAAEYVLARDRSPTMLYSAPIDTGYFVFFVRKHDPSRERIVLRADKMLTTSMMDRLSVDDRIQSPEEIYGILDRYGVRFVVIEDRATGSQPLEWLRQEVRGPRFRLAQQFPIRTQDRRLNGVTIGVYEYLETKPFSPDAEIDVGLPLIGRDIHLKLSDLVGSSR